MLAVRDIMTRDVVTVSPELEVRDLLELLSSRHLSGVPVVVGGRVVGVISATDVLALAAESPGVPTERPTVPDLEEWETPEEWEAGGEPPGAFFHELWADVGADVLERFAATATPEWNPLAGRTVAEVMTQRPLCTVRPEADVAAAARHMLRAGVHRLLVMRDGELVGILAMTDIVRAVGEERLGGAPSRRRKGGKHERDAA
jgi:CBS domain-containing protein